MKINGTLTTASPLMIAEPNAGDVKVNLSGRLVKNGFPGTKVVHIPIPKTATHDGANLPVISANTLRGGLRRAGASLIEEALIKRGETLTLGAYHALRCGTPYGHPDKASLSLSDIRAAQEVPPLAVFGGGPRMMESALRVDTGFPITNQLIARGLLPQALEDQALADDQWLTKFLFLRRADDAATFVDHNLAEHVVTDYAQGIDAWQILVGQAGSSGQEKEGKDAPKKDSNKGEDESVMRALATITGVQCVIPGTPFSFAMEITTEHPASVGFALLSLARFANKQTLGGYKRIGFGRFALDVAASKGGNDIPVLKRSGDTYEVDDSHPEVAAAVKAAHKWLDAISAAELDQLLLPSETSRAAVKKKLKGNKEAEQAFEAVYGA